MATTDFLPGREAELVTWINTFKSLITVNFAMYGLSSAQQAAYGTAATNFINAYNVAKADATRSPSNIIAKDAMKKIVIGQTRQLAGIVQKFPGTTNEMRSQLGLTVPAPHSPIAPPTDVPTLEIVERLGTMIRLRLHDATGNRSKPAGVRAANVYSHVGPTAPVQIGDWSYEGEATRAFVDITFPAETVPGTVVWFTAQWKNPRGEAGPGCAAVSAIIAGGAMEAAA
jgi:hypothetical protein